jgi:quercetin dioxygenase-like cupin family protein
MSDLPDHTGPVPDADQTGPVPDADQTGPVPDAGPEHDADPPAVVPVDLRDYVEFSQDAARRVRVLATDALAVDLWCIEPGQATPVLRYDDRDVAYTVVGGRSWFVTEEGEVGLDPMGALLVPAGVVHGIDNRAVDPLIVVASVSPPGAERPTTPVSDDAAAIRRDDAGPNPIARAWRAVMTAGRERP